MKAAMIAASKAKYQQKHSTQATKILNPEEIKQELYNARKLKLEQKLVIRLFDILVETNA
jgi:hypothetical protein